MSGPGISFKNIRFAGRVRQPTRGGEFGLGGKATALGTERRRRLGRWGRKRQFGVGGIFWVGWYRGLPQWGDRFWFPCGFLNFEEAINYGFTKSTSFFARKLLRHGVMELLLLAPALRRNRPFQERRLHRKLGAPAIQGGNGHLLLMGRRHGSLGR